MLHLLLLCNVYSFKKFFNLTVKNKDIYSPTSNDLTIFAPKHIKYNHLLIKPES